MSATRETAGIGYEQMPRSLVDEQIAAPKQIQKQGYLSFNVGRWVNPHAEEFADLRSYIHQLGAANTEDEPAASLRERGETEYHPTRIINPEDVHVMSIYASDARELLMRAFGGRNDQFRQLDRVKQKVRGMRRRYRDELKERNFSIQDAVTADLQTPEANPRYFPVDPRDLGHVALRMTSGIFDTKPDLKGFGDGRKFGIIFSAEAERFLDEERAVSLDFILSRLGITHIDTDLEDRILGRQHHATLIKKGGSDPYSLSYPTDELGDILPVPDTLVTGLDPTMRYIDANSQRTA